MDIDSNNEMTLISLVGSIYYNISTSRVYGSMISKRLEYTDGQWVSTIFDSTDNDPNWKDSEPNIWIGNYSTGSNKDKEDRFKSGPFNTHIESDNIIYFETNHHYITSKWTKNGEVWEKSNIGNYTSINEVGGSELINKYTSNYYKYDDIFVSSVDEKYLIFYNIHIHFSSYNFKLFVIL